MSVMSKGELQKIVFALSTLLDFEISEQCDILDPAIIINALDRLFPQAEPQLRAISNIQNQEEIWGYVIEFVEINILEGEQLPFQELTQKEIAQLYMILIEFTEQAIQEGQQGQQYEEKAEKNVGKQNKIKKQQKVQEKKNNNKYKQTSKEKKKDNKQKKKQQQKITKYNEVKEKEKEKEKEKPKSKSKPKSQIKQKSKSKQVEKKSFPKQKKPAPIKPQKKASVSSKPKPKESPSKSKQKPKESVSSEQPLQNQVIKQITAAMKVVRTKDKNKLLMKDPQSTQEVMKAKRKFQYYLKQFKNEGKRQNKTGKNIVDSTKKLGLDNYFLKVLQKRQKNIQQMVINEQIKYFTALRDKKVAFINKIHKLTEKLQRQRLTQKQKQQRRILLQQRAKVHAKIQQGNTLFEKNMWLLKQNYQALRKKRDLQQYDERAICKQMQSCMKKKKMQQLQDIKTLWQQENMKLNNIVGDQQKVKNRLIDIYRKNRP